MTGPGPVQGGARQRLERILARIEAAARRAGRDPSGVTLVGVTKTVPPNRIVEAVRAGLSHLGENRLQEAETKVSAEGLTALPLTWHLVGHLQSNKAKRAAELFSWVHSIDSVDLAHRLGRLAAGRAVPLKVLIQVDLGHEPTKHGVDVSQLEELARETAGQKSLELRGLMTIPPLLADPESARPFFRELRGLRDRLASRGLDLPELSMGMTGDFEVGVEEGATLVRVGRALFGERPE